MADDQTPPENPFEDAHENGNGNGNDNGPHVIEGNGDALPQGAPNVAAKAGKTYIMLGIVGLVVAFLLYSILGSKPPKPMENTPNTVEIDKKEALPPPLQTDTPTQTTAPPPLVVPELPPLVQVQVPPAAQLPGGGGVPNINPLTPKEDSAAKAQQLARLRTAIMVKDGGAAALANATDTTKPPTPTGDPNTDFASTLGVTKSERVEATRIGDLRRTIAQGRIIQATLESAINTDLPAPIRAIVSLDVYGEAGTVPLIPKGSRLIGKYNNTITAGQTRVFVVWQRVIRPDGVDIILTSSANPSPLVDVIGQAGVSGQLDTKFQEIFARSLVSSVMNIAMAIGSDKISGGGDTTTTTSTTGTQTSGDAVTTATTNALNRLGNTTDGFLQKFLSVPPTILVDQGTKVNVFVNKDLIFPGDMSGTVIIQ